MISKIAGKQHLTGQTAIIGGQTVRLATPSGTLLKAGSTLTGQGGKQIILQKLTTISCSAPCKCGPWMKRSDVKKYCQWKSPLFKLPHRL